MYDYGTQDANMEHYGQVCLPSFHFHPQKRCAVDTLTIPSNKINSIGTYWKDNREV